MNVESTMKKDTYHPFVFLAFILQLSVPIYIGACYLLEGTVTTTEEMTTSPMLVAGSSNFSVSRLFDIMVTSYTIAFFMILFLIVAGKRLSPTVIYFFGINIIMLILHFIIQYFLYFF